MVYRTTPEADEDIRLMFRAGAIEYGLQRAEAYVEGLFDLFELIGQQPLLMRVRPEFTPAVRIRGYRAHMVIYREDDGDAIILRVLHGRQNLVDEI